MKWTLQDLDDAWKQMHETKDVLKKDADTALAWLVGELGFGDGYFNVLDNPAFGKYPPHRVSYVIVMYYDQNTTKREKYVDFLNKATWAKKGKYILGRGASEPVYDVETPTGFFRVTFQHSGTLWSHH